MTDTDPGNPDPLERIAAALERLCDTLAGVELTLDAIDRRDSLR